MIDNIECKRLVYLDNIQIINKLEVISYYIHEKKNVDIGNINIPNNPISEHLMNIAYGIASNYYKEKYGKEESKDESKS